MEARPYTIRELFFRHIAQTSPSPLGIEIQRADGVFLYSSDNRRYIDLVSGVSVSNIGHGNKEVIDAVKNQTEKHMHLMVYGEIIQSPQVEHATLLCSQLPASMQSVYFVNSGSEANEAAIKLAKRHTGRFEIVSCENSYHGSSHGALSLMSDESFKSSFRPLLPGIRHIRFNNLGDLETITEKSACVIIEPVQAEAGVIIPDEGYLDALRKRCTKTGSLLIFDEIQTGFGRCGKLFAFQKFGVSPDIITLAKALGGGMPLGALAASEELMRDWQSDPVLGHITTFGGHPVSCAAAVVSLKVLLRERWIDEVDKKAELFVRAIGKHPLVKEIRAAGLLIAVDLGNEEYARRVLPMLIEEGVLSDWFLFCPTAFRIAPPLCISEEEVEYSIEKIIRVLDKLNNQ